MLHPSHTVSCRIFPIRCILLARVVISACLDAPGVSPRLEEYCDRDVDSDQRNHPRKPSRLHPKTTASTIPASGCPSTSPASGEGMGPSMSGWRRGTRYRRLENSRRRTLSTRASLRRPRATIKHEDRHGSAESPRRRRRRPWHVARKQVPPRTSSVTSRLRARRPRPPASRQRERKEIAREGVRPPKLRALADRGRR